MFIVDCIQGTEEWHKVRLGKMTASHAQAIAAGDKGLETYCRQLAAEIFTGTRPESYKNEDMQRGNDDEQFARDSYSLVTGREVEQVGFMVFDKFEHVGASPDGLIGGDGGLEIKRKTNLKHNDLLLGAEKFESKYIWQCKMNMLIRGAEWWDLVSFNPNFKGKSLFIQTITRSAEDDEKLLRGFEKGEQLIKHYLEILNR